MFIIKLNTKKGFKKTKKYVNYWNEYKNYSLNWNLNKFNCDKFSLDLLSFNNQKEVIIENNRKKKDTHEYLEEDIKKVLFKNNKRILKSIQIKNVDYYLWEVKRCGLQVMENQEIKFIKNLEKSVFQTLSIVNMILAQQNKKLFFSLSISLA